MIFQKILGAMLLCTTMVVSGCVYPAPPENISVNTYGKVSIAGIVIPGASPTAPPLLVIGTYTMDLAQTPAVYEEGTHPLQAVYRQYENGQMTLEVLDSNTNCGSFNLMADVSTPDVDTGIGSKFCMGVGAQDLGAGLGAGTAN